MAGLLLTGGKSRRMGRDKASIVIDVATGETLASRLGRVLEEVADPALEVGPGWSRLERAEADLGEGPLTGIAAGWRSLRSGVPGAGTPPQQVIVLATDLPNLTPAVLVWLSARPEEASVVPVVGGRTQPLCARWCAADLDRAVEIVERGGRAVSAALGPATAYLGESEWGSVAAEAAFRDADRPEDLVPGAT
ncbi:MAG: NTP transferase domain-containing protein [Acidimicrobiales bacterium]